MKKDSDDANATVKISAGQVNVRGLKAGTYYLVETTAPEGYNMLTTPYEVTINGEGTITGADNNLVKVVNEQGVLLPSTGGIGTTVFAVAGLVIMAGAAAVLVIKKRS